MKAFSDFLLGQKVKVYYVPSKEDVSDIRKLIPVLASERVRKIILLDPTDNWLEMRIRKTGRQEGLELEILESQLFFNSKSDLEKYFET
ncbi:cryptochrome/photolyase family protein [Echinicola jeungdonensis]|uniref:Cryptochrome/photolyase family protein n=1 Tax=Echinicola jeungdonensis TaxID=709343 RepID=A0ABV5J4Q8_9BACT